MADFTSFATGFVGRLNEQQAARMKTKRDDDSAAKAADKAMSLKAYYADTDTYTEAQTARAPIQGMIDAGQGDALFIKLSEGMNKTEIANLRAVFEKGDQGEIMALVDSAYAVPEKPNSKDARYSGRGAPSSRLMDEKGDYANHPIAQMLGWTGNKHLDKRARRGAVVEEPAAVERAPLSFSLPETVADEDMPSKNPITMFLPSGETVTDRADSPVINEAIKLGASTVKPLAPLRAVPLDAKAMTSVRGTIETLKEEPGPYKEFMDKFDEADSGAGDERDQILNDLYQEISLLRADRKYTEQDIGTLTGIAINRINNRISIKDVGFGMQDVILQPRGAYPIMTPEQVRAAPSGTKFMTTDGRTGTKP